MRLAAISTNIGWAPGAIVISAADYARAWESTRTGNGDAARAGAQIENAPHACLLYPRREAVFDQLGDR